jgi:hypothetical protein
MQTKRDKADPSAKDTSPIMSYCRNNKTNGELTPSLNVYSPSPLTHQPHWQHKTQLVQCLAYGNTELPSLSSSSSDASQQK